MKHSDHLLDRHDLKCQVHRYDSFYPAKVLIKFLEPY
jgi:hypothetical protein